jgi:hypothetical protein
VTAPTFVTNDQGPAVEQIVVRDMLQRGLWVAPAILLLAGLPWGIDGALSAAFAIALVAVNFALAAALLAWTARISFALMMGAALGGYLLRLALIAAAVLAVKSQPWVELWPLGLTLIATHLGLLAWETRYVSASLAFPALKPATAKEKR